jgi:hypothetical protein
MAGSPPFQLPDEDADAPQRRADRQGLPVEAEQQQRLRAEEGRGDQGGQLLGAERADQRSSRSPSPSNPQPDRGKEQRSSDLNNPSPRRDAARPCASHQPNAVVMKRGETAWEVHRAGRSRQVLLFKGVPASGDVLACWSVQAAVSKRERATSKRRAGSCSRRPGSSLRSSGLSFSSERCGSHGMAWSSTRRALLRCSYQRAGDLERSVDRRGAPGDRGASVVDGRRAPKRQRTRLSGGTHPFGRIGVAMRRHLASDRNGT